MCRRSRYGRHPQGEPPVIGPRDVEIFQLLDRYQVLRSGHIRAFFPDADKGRLLKRLGRLYHEAPYINRLDNVARYRISREMQSVYQLDVLGRQELARRGLLKSSERLIGALSDTGNFHHSLMICDILADIDSTARRLGITLHPWENLWIRRGDEVLTPDAIFTLQYADQSYRHFCLEADRGTEPIYRANASQTSIYRKFTLYQKLLLNPAPLGIKAPLFVVFITVGESRLEKMREQLRAMEKLGLSRMLFKTIKGNGFGAPPADGTMLTDPFLRCLYPPLRIDVR